MLLRSGDTHVIGQVSAPVEYDGTITHRTQLPIIPGWAVTAHRIQGATLPLVAAHVVDCFADGQAYVMLSRVPTLGSIHLTGFEPDSIRVDQDLIAWLQATALKFSQAFDLDSDDLKMLSESVGTSLHHVRRKMCCFIHICVCDWHRIQSEPCQCLDVQDHGNVGGFLSLFLLSPTLKLLQVLLQVPLQVTLQALLHILLQPLAVYQLTLLRVPVCIVRNVDLICHLYYHRNGLACPSLCR